MVAETIRKTYVSYSHVHSIISKAAKRIQEDGFQPDVILAIGGGGFIPARVIRTFLKTPIKAVSLELYDDLTDAPRDEVKVNQWIQLEDVKDKNVLVVDEIDDTRSTLYYCVNELRKMQPKSISIFVLQNKLKKKAVANHWSPDGKQHPSSEISYYVSGENVEDTWTVFPWEAIDIQWHQQQIHNTF